MTKFKSKLKSLGKKTSSEIEQNPTAHRINTVFFLDLVEMVEIFERISFECLRFPMVQWYKVIRNARRDTLWVYCIQAIFTDWMFTTEQLCAPTTALIHISTYC